ncbi:hypothetical protein FA13DRAFT_1796217 [Coprinellus micaceus]|uniref:Uncharacterized protein n=1 Tax=Coprinellus micaceus TaxID=71717 RepID=A0A4Y7SWT8_COPMI|nr:hypothetical protein FA13DRAFT_1796217 [Coprinellus micaceus]
MKFARLARADRVQGPKPGHSAPMVLESERPGEVMGTPPPLSMNHEPEPTACQQ